MKKEKKSKQNQKHTHFTIQKQKKSADKKFMTKPAKTKSQDNQKQKKF